MCHDRPLRCRTCMGLTQGQCTHDEWVLSSVGSLKQHDKIEGAPWVRGGDSWQCTRRASCIFSLLTHRPCQTRPVASWGRCRVPANCTASQEICYWTQSRSNCMDSPSWQLSMEALRCSQQLPSASVLSHGCIILHYRPQALVIREIGCMISSDAALWNNVQILMCPSALPDQSPSTSPVGACL